MAAPDKQQGQVFGKIEVVASSLRCVHEEDTANPAVVLLFLLQRSEDLSIAHSAAPYKPGVPPQTDNNCPRQPLPKAGCGWHESCGAALSLALGS